MFYAKRDGELRVDLSTIFAPEIREENLFDTFNRILSVRDGIEGDGCVYRGNRGKEGYKQLSNLERTEELEGNTEEGEEGKRREKDAIDTTEDRTGNENAIAPLSSPEKIRP